MSFTIDTNILYYSIDQLNPRKRPIAADIVNRSLTADCIITTHVLGEFLGAVRRKNKVAYPDAVLLAGEWSALFTTVNTAPAHMLYAAALADRYKLQFWDSLILAVAQSAGVEIMLTEEMQDGATIDGVTLLDPFNPANHARIDALLAG